MLGKKQIRAIFKIFFLIQVQMGCKAVDTIHIISNTFGPWIAHKHTVQWWLKKFCKGDKSLEDKDHSDRRPEVDNRLRAIIEADTLTTTWEVARELNVDHSIVIWHLEQIGRWESLISGCHMRWLKIKKLSLWSVLFSYSTQQQWTLSQLDCDMQWKVDFIWQPALTSSVVGLSGSSKVLPKAKLTPKTGHGHCLVVCCWSDPLYLSESQWNHYIWEVCSANQWDASKTEGLQLALVNRMDPILLHGNAQPHVTQTIWLLLHQGPWQLFAGKMLPQPEGRKCFPITQVPKHRFLHYRNKCWQKRVDCNGSYFD